MIISNNKMSIGSLRSGHHQRWRRYRLCPIYAHSSAPRQLPSTDGFPVVAVRELPPYCHCRSLAADVLWPHQYRQQCPGHSADANSFRGVIEAMSAQGTCVRLNPLVRPMLLAHDECPRSRQLKYDCREYNRQSYSDALPRHCDISLGVLRAKALLGRGEGGPPITVLHDAPEREIYHRHPIHTLQTHNLQLHQEPVLPVLSILHSYSQSLF